MPIVLLNFFFFFFFKCLPNPAIAQNQNGGTVMTTFGPRPSLRVDETNVEDFRIRGDNLSNDEIGSYSVRAAKLKVILDHSAALQCLQPVQLVGQPSRHS